jgi:hypothetical protein
MGNAFRMAIHAFTIGLRPRQDALDVDLLRRKASSPAIVVKQLAEHEMEFE